MRGYAERQCFTPATIELWKRASVFVSFLPSEQDAQGREIRCHELARALATVLELPIESVVDGSSVGVEHSWIWLDRTTLLDPYVPGRMPMVQLIDIGSPTLIRLCYAQEPRFDIRADVVEVLVQTMKGWMKP